MRFAKLDRTAASVSRIRSHHVDCFTMLTQIKAVERTPGRQWTLVILDSANGPGLSELCFPETRDRK